MSKHAPPVDYQHSGRYDHAAFEKGLLAAFRGEPKFNAPSVPSMLGLLGRIGDDPRITDVRWTAYILATMLVESSQTIWKKTVTKDKKGRSRVHKFKVWRNFEPVEEKGHGREFKYGRPVKVTRLPDGNIKVVEYDGDSWIISATTGHARDVAKGQKLGTAPDAESVPAYDNDDGDEHYYFGRGYVQLTWWSNYATAGVVMGRGMELLLDPDLVEDPDTAYQIMITGMCTGKIFAHGHKLSDYFRGSHTDYVGARTMVNPKAKHANKVEVAKVAQRFERLLLASKPKPRIAKK